MTTGNDKIEGVGNKYNGLSKLGLLLKERGLSQADFIKLIEAKTEGKVKYQKGRVSRYVNSKVLCMTTDTLKVMANALDVPVSDIMP